MKTTIIAILYATVIVACTFAIKANAQTTMTTIGGTTYINRPMQPTIVCTRVGQTVYCN